MAETYGTLTDDQGVCGCHVYVGVPDLEHAVRASNQLRPWLPALLLLSANSPFFDGHDTGHASWRTNIWDRMLGEQDQLRPDEAAWEDVVRGV